MNQKTIDDSVQRVFKYFFIGGAVVGGAVAMAGTFTGDEGLRGFGYGIITGDALYATSVYVISPLLRKLIK
ncbi:MAG TPA: hypothetical protein VJJ82_00055 [Candidatus Nanoarchaeia archaeon]|nr:hypothetical protein [Candidatus Nanoarchaeia archaeon]